jgi:hypothetical protein
LGGLSGELGDPVEVLVVVENGESFSLGGGRDEKVRDLARRQGD